MVVQYTTRCTRGSSGTLYDGSGDPKPVPVRILLVSVQGCASQTTAKTVRSETPSTTSPDSLTSVARAQREPALTKKENEKMCQFLCSRGARTDRQLAVSISTVCFC